MLFRLAIIATLLAVVSAQSWAPITTDTETMILSISCASENNCFTAGADNGKGAVLQRSTDGGIHWKRAVTPVSMAWMAIAFEKSETETHGIATGFGIGESADIYTNDGELWNKTQSRSMSIVTASQDCSTITGIDGGFAIVGSLGNKEGIRVSKDGGVTYTFYQYPVLRDMARYGSFPSATTWFISGGEFPSDPAFKHLSHRIRVPLEADADGNRAPILGAYPKALGNTTGYSASIVMTTDGGKTFTQVFNDVGRFYFNQISCPDVSTCFAVAEGFDGDWVGAAVYNTVDGGKTWTQQIFVPGASMMAVEMLSTTEGWVGGVIAQGEKESGVFWHTTDGGANWVEDSSFVNTAVVDIEFLSPTSAWAAVLERQGDGTLYRYN